LKVGHAKEATERGIAALAPGVVLVTTVSWDKLREWSKRMARASWQIRCIPFRRLQDDSP